MFVTKGGHDRRGRDLVQEEGRKSNSTCDMKAAGVGGSKGTQAGMGSRRGQWTGEVEQTVVANARKCFDEAHYCIC